MNAFVMLMLLFVHADAFSCSYSKLEQALPEIKQFIQPSLFEKLQHVLWKIGNSLKNANHSTDDKAIGKLILECLDGHQEKDRCLAHLSIHYGYMSISDKYVSYFLKLDLKQIDQLRAANRICLAKIRGTIEGINKLPYQKIYESAYERYSALPFEYYSILDAEQKNRFLLLYTDYNRSRDFKILFARLIAEETRQRQQKDFYSRMEPNIQQHMLGGWLILLDSKEAHSYLMINHEQDEQIKRLYASYHACVTELQELLSNDIKNDADSS